MPDGHPGQRPPINGRRSLARRAIRSSPCFANGTPWIFGVGISAIVNEVAMFGVIALVFAALLRVLPDRPPRGRDAWFGALLSAALFAAGKFAVGAYVTRYAVASTYGAVGTAIAIMLWIYFTAAIVLFGAVIKSVTTVPRSVPMRE